MVDPPTSNMIMKLMLTDVVKSYFESDVQRDECFLCAVIERTTLLLIHRRAGRFRESERGRCSCIKVELFVY